MRTFVALSVGDGPALQELVACRDALASSRADVKWVSAGHFHITLRFLGDIDLPLLNDIRTAVSDAAATTPGPLDVTLTKAGCFKRDGRPSAIWMQGEDDGGMAALERELTSRLSRLSFEPDRKPFQAHITLGRAKSPRGSNELMRAIDRWNASARPVPHRFEVLTLFESRLTPSGPIYTELLEAPLGARPTLDHRQERQESGQI